MKTKRLITLIIALFLLQLSATKAQNKFHIALDYHYNLGVSERYWGHSFGRSQSEMYGNSLHLTALYDITSRVSTGIGIGADQYENPGYSTFPIFGTFRYRPLLKHLNGYVFTDLGYGVFKREDIQPGWLWNAGIGYTKMFRKHFGLNLQLGYNLKEFGDIPSYEIDFEKQEINFVGKKSSVRHSISLGIGLVF